MQLTQKSRKNSVNKISTFGDLVETIFQFSKSTGEACAVVADVVNRRRLKFSQLPHLHIEVN